MLRFAFSIRARLGPPTPSSGIRPQPSGGRCLAWVAWVSGRGPLGSLTFRGDAINVGILFGDGRVMNDKAKRPDEPMETAPGGKIDFDEIRRVIALLEEKNLSLFELEVEGFKLRIERGVPAAVAASGQTVQQPSGPSTGTGSSSSAPAPEVDKSLHVVTSPMVGTFYRAPDPTAHPFVDIGDVVKKGQTMCIIEAMKLMNEIEADIDGTVVEVFVENAKPVEFGQKLFAIKPQS